MATDRNGWWAGTLVMALLLAGCQAATGEEAAVVTETVQTYVGSDGYPQRWCYLPAKLADDPGCDTFLANLKLAAANKCTHIIMPEGRWMRFADDQAYLARVAKIKAAAQDLKVTIVPAVISIGYSGRYFHYDANLAAGLPVKDLVYAVQEGKGVPDATETPDLGTLKKEGESILRGKLTVKPFHHYRIWVTTDKQAKVEVEGKSLARKRNNILTNAKAVKIEGDTATWVTSFNSLDADAIDVRISVSGAKLGEVKIENAGMLLIVRRPLVPLTVTSEDGKTIYEEGRDFEKIIDPCLKKDPYDGETTNDHAPAELVLTEDSRIKNGDKLKLSFWHTVRIYDDQDCISLEDPRTHEIYENEFINCHKVWGAGSYFVNYDEIRIGGWEPMADGRQRNPGELLAEHFKKTYDMIRKHAPKTTLYTWSDMFTPYHNARPFSEKGYYYLVNGNYDNAWLGVPKDVIIMNWYAPKVEGVKFFADLGYQQVLCGYYDGTSTQKMTANIERWKTVSAGQPGILGFMYTTWHMNYKNLAEYFQLLDAQKDAAATDTAANKPQAEPGVPTGH